MTSKNKDVIIIGAGLCGSLLALRLAQRGCKVRVYEKRSDPRTSELYSGRSINLAFSNRGNKAMKLVGLENKVIPLCIPMKGRLIHDKLGNTIQSNYSGNTNEFINSISRKDLNILLINEAENHPDVSFHFNISCTTVDFKSKIVHLKDSSKVYTVNASVIFAADGAGSILRKSYEACNRFNFKCTQEFLSHGYKELSILATKSGTYKISKDVLHIWPRKDFMLIALPNLDGSFTVTLFLSHDNGVNNFTLLKNEKSVLDFFKNEFPDTLEIMPNLAHDFFENPTSNLGTIKCEPWNYKGNSLLIGDAAHAIVPFYGQGMNASFEDVVELDKIIDQFDFNWELIFEKFNETRKKDTDAIADLAIDNFYEMKEHVADPKFQIKRQIEIALEKQFPNEYASKYSLVTFNENMGYDEAMNIGRLQDKLLLEYIENKKIKEPFKLEAILEFLKFEINSIKIHAN